MCRIGSMRDGHRFCLRVQETTLASVFLNFLRRHEHCLMMIIVVLLGCDPGESMADTFAATMPPELLAKRDKLLEALRGLGGAAVAFSGGIDSTLVAKAARQALGDRAIAVTADSPSVARSELEDACRLARQIGIRHRIVKTDEFANPDYIRNDGTRCYFCKSELYSQIEGLL